MSQDQFKGITKEQIERVLAADNGAYHYKALYEDAKETSFIMARQADTLERQLRALESWASRAREVMAVSADNLEDAAQCLRDSGDLVDEEFDEAMEFDLRALAQSPDCMPKADERIEKADVSQIMIRDEREAMERLILDLQEKVDSKLRSIMAGNYSVLVDSYRGQIGRVFDEALDAARAKGER